VLLTTFGQIQTADSFAGSRYLPLNHHLQRFGASGQPHASMLCGSSMGLKTATHKTDAFQELLERSEAELVEILRKREGITIEKSADQMDEIQYASERDLAIRNVDRESRMLRQVRAALRRVHEGTFGICLDCESAIGPKRLLAVPSAPRCIECQGAADREGLGNTESFSDTLVTSV
jgi:DnaK suppressor protein